jgi:hypothetical protein
MQSKKMPHAQPFTDCWLIFAASLDSTFSSTRLTMDLPSVMTKDDPDFLAR